MPLLELDGLSRRFGALLAVDEVDLHVETGEIRAIIGPNGAGKSTLFNLITSVVKPTAGRVRFANEDITGLPVQDVAQKGIARTFQLCHVFPALSARENGDAVLRRSAEEADGALLRLGLEREADTRAGTLGHGDQRLLEIAMAVAQRPRLLLLDEPTQGLSVKETDHTVDILKSMLADRDLSVILVEHDMEVVFRLADFITVLHRGRVIADGSPAAVKESADVRSAYLGEFG